MERLNSTFIEVKKEDEDSPYEMVTPLPLSTQSSIRSQISREIPTPTSPIIHNTLPNKNDESDYDKLQYFGTIHKSDHNPAYRTPNINVPPKSLPLLSTTMDASQKLKSNDYDIVEDMSTVRLADDSHLGYGVIRKKSTTSTSEPEHKVYNNSEYAIVSKPKRV